MSALLGLVPMTASVVSAACLSFYKERAASIESTREKLIADYVAAPRRRWRGFRFVAYTPTREEAIAALSRSHHPLAYSPWSWPARCGFDQANDIAQVGLAADAMKPGDTIYVNTRIVAWLGKHLEVKA